MSYQPVRQPRLEWLTVRGLRHRLTWWGSPGDDPIVLLHGFQDCGATWQFLADCLPESWSLVAPDWRGFGATEWAADGYWYPDYLADLEALLDSLIPTGRARLIGHSMGANVAALYAGVRPQRVQWLINLEGLGLAATTADMAPSRYAQWLDELKQPQRVSQYDSTQQLASVLRERNPRLPEDHAAFVAQAWSRPTESAGGYRLSFDPRHRRVNPVLYRLEEAQACWARVEVPVLLLLGGASGHLQRGQGEKIEARFRAGFADIRIVTLPGLGHMMHHEAPRAVAEPIIEFVNARA